MIKSAFALATAAVCVVALAVPGAMADPTGGDIYYTTFSGGMNVHKVSYLYDGSTFSLNNNINLAATSGADGLLFGPNGNLLVAGQGFNVTEVQTDGTIVDAVNPGGPSFHLALTSGAPNALLYNLANGGAGNQAISAVELSGGGLLNNGVAYTVSGTNTQDLDVRGLAFNPGTGNWYYGTAPDGGVGEFGTVVFDDILHTAELTRLQFDMYAHGLTYDPYSGNIIVNSAGTVQQLDALGNVVSFFNGPGDFDQSAVDGNGHLFVASNAGFLQFVDYAGSGLVGDAGNFSAAPFLAETLDDIAPLSGLGSTPVPEPSTWALLGLGLFVCAGLARRRAVRQPA